MPQGDLASTFFDNLVFGVFPLPSGAFQVNIKASPAHLTRDPLAGLSGLASKVAIIVPTTIHDTPAPANVVAYQREKVAESFSRWFGGFSEYAGNGGWYSERLGKLIREPVYRVEAGCDPAALARCLPSVLDLARSIAVAMEQEAVTVEVNGKTYFVPAPAPQPAPASV